MPSLAERSATLAVHDDRAAAREDEREGGERFRHAAPAERRTQSRSSSTSVWTRASISFRILRTVSRS